jgi:hypothetical protein
LVMGNDWFDDWTYDPFAYTNLSVDGSPYYARSGIGTGLDRAVARESPRFQ